MKVIYLEEMELHASNLHEIESVKCSRRMDYFKNVGFSKIPIYESTNLIRLMKIENMKLATSRYELHFEFRENIQRRNSDLESSKNSQSHCIRSYMYILVTGKLKTCRYNSSFHIM